MGTFNILAPILAIISTPSSEPSQLSSIPFHPIYLKDPWNIISLRTLDEYAIPNIMEMPLFVAETTYQVALEPGVDSGPSSLCT